MKKRLSMVMVLVILCTSILPVFAEETQVSLEEVVYGILNADGTAKEIVVSQHILGHDGEGVVLESSLTDVEPLMNDLNIEATDLGYALKSSKDELYLTGKSTNALPVTTEILYFLDDESISAKDIVGKSGHLKIVVRQENTSQVEVVVDEEKHMFFLPFETALVTNVSNEMFKNVSISSGKIIDDGHTKIISAVLSPGFKENFEMEASDVIVDQVTIEADVEALTLNAFYMTTVCKLPEIDFDALSGNFTDAFDKVDEFESASETLLQGSKDLNAGTSNFFGKQTEALNAFDAYLNKDQMMLKSILEFNGGVSGFNTAFNLYTTGVLDFIKGVESLSAGSTNVDAGLKGFRSQLAQAMPESEATAPLYQGLDQLIAGMTQLDQGLKAAEQGGSVLKEKTLQLMAASSQLEESNGKLKAGANQLLAANQQITPVISQLRAGANTYVSGVTSFNQGVAQFKTQGVDMLIEEVETAFVKVEMFKGKYKILKELADDYNSYSNTNSDMDGSVIFVLKTEALK